MEVRAMAWCGEAVTSYRVDGATSPFMDHDVILPSACLHDAACVRGLRHGGKGGSCSRNPRRATPRGPRVTDPRAWDTACMHNATCVRGFRHGGKGGRCRLQSGVPPPLTQALIAKRLLSSVPTSTTSTASTASWRRLPIAMALLPEVSTVPYRDVGPDPPSPWASPRAPSPSPSPSPSPPPPLRALLEVDFGVLAREMGAVEAAVACARARLDAGLAPPNTDRAYIAFRYG